MPDEYDMGTLTIVGHDVEKLTQALGIPDDRFDDIAHLAQAAWQHGESVSHSIEFLAQNSSGSELALAMIFFGRVWELEEPSNQEDDE